MSQSGNTAEQQSDRHDPSRPPPVRQRRTGRPLAQLSAVAVLAAVLSSGATVAALEVLSDDSSVSVSPASPTAAAEETPATSATPASLGTVEDWSGVADQVSPSVVSISAASSQGAGAGSGVVWDSEGRIVTNAHVVAGASEVAVTLADGRQYPAEVVGSDSTTDIAVLAISSAPNDLQPIDRGATDGLTVGAPVMAIGNPLGLSGTVTTGIVSALDRPVTTQSTETDPANGAGVPVVSNAIQTSAPINPGNSGGALVDSSGALIGVNTAIASLGGTGSAAGSIGIGFAIPVETVTSVAEQLIENGQATHALLGVGLEDGQIEADGATVAAATVARVEPGSAAADAGIQVGDAIVSIDGDRVDGSLALIGQVRALTPGDQATVEVVRDGEQLSIEVTLQAQPD